MMIPMRLTIIVLSILIGCVITAVGFGLSLPVGGLIVAPGITIAYWLVSGRVHEVSYALLSVGLNCAFYAAAVYVLLSLYERQRSIRRAERQPRGSS